MSTQPANAAGFDEPKPRRSGELFGHPPTGKMVSWAGAAVFTFSGELIRDLWVLGDVHSLLQQLE